MKYVRNSQLALLSVLSLSLASTNAKLLCLPPSKERIFLFKSRAKTETLIVNFLNSRAINFRLTSVNKLTKATASLTGIARVAADVTDPEIDGNEQGEAYAVDEFLFGGKCGLAIRIDTENHKLAKVYSTSYFESTQLKQHAIGFDCRQPMHVVK